MITIYSFVQSKIAELNEGSSWSRAMLAKLRRGVGKIPGELPDILGYMLIGAPEKWDSFDGKPSKEELAVYNALTLYALHQQGKTEIMNISGKDENGKGSGASFGTACGRLVKAGSENLTAIKKRFDAVITSIDFNEFVYHARGIIQLLKSNDITFDYPRFAEDMYRFQFAEQQNRIRLKWGEDFYRVIHKINIIGEN